ncbi:MAG TPA: hypothetical protein VL346_08275 [Acidobacteriaceae bacterium]|nr:hypothetical protein [Acidobacteriaceae bacterium]
MEFHTQCRQRLYNGLFYWRDDRRFVSVQAEKWRRKPIAFADRWEFRSRHRGDWSCRSRSGRLVLFI